MTKIRIPEVLGEKYPKILVVGESYYSNDDYDRSVSSESFPAKVREKWLSKDGTIRYFDLINEFLKEYTIADNLQDVTFYNYAQRIMKEPHENSEKDEYVDYGEAFFELLKKIKPDYVLFFSIRSYMAIPNISKDETIRCIRRPNLKEREYIYEHSNQGNRYAHWCYYELEGKKIPVLGFPHLVRTYPNLKNNSVIREIFVDSGVAAQT